MLLSINKYILIAILILPATSNAECTDSICNKNKIEKGNGSQSKNANEIIKADERKNANPLPNSLSPEQMGDSIRYKYGKPDEQKSPTEPFCNDAVYDPDQRRMMKKCQDGINR